MTRTNNTYRLGYTAIFALGLFMAPLLLSAQEVNSKKQLTRDDYDQWERLGRAVNTSSDGNWIIYSITKNDGDTELRLYNSQSAAEEKYIYASSPSFSKDNKWLCYKNGVSAKEAKKLKKDKKPVPKKVTLRNLISGDSIEFEEVSAFEFSGNGLFLAMRYSKPKEKKSDGSDLVIRNLSSGEEFNFGNVSEFKWQDEGELLAMIIDADNKAGNGVQLFSPISGSLKVLDSKDSKYKDLNWRKKSSDLVFSREEKNEDYDDNSYTLFIYQGLDSKTQEKIVFDHTKVTEFPLDYRIVDTDAIKWSKNGETVFFNIFERVNKEKDEADSTSNDLSVADSTKITKNKTVEEAPDVEIWHSKDAVLLSEQKKSNEKSSKEPFLVAYHIEQDKFVQLEDELTERVNFQDDSPTLIGIDATPYEFEGLFGRPKGDGYAIDIATGKKSKIADGASSFYTFDPSGTYVVFAKENQLILQNIKTKKEQKITEGLEGLFFNSEDDHPVEFFRPFGFVGWAASAKMFYVNSKYNVWQFSVDGSKKLNITNGEVDKTIYRYRQLDNSIDYIDSKKPMLMSIRGEWSKKTGYAEVSIGKSPKKIIWQDAYISISKKVKDSNKLVYSRQTYSNSPDLFITTDNFNSSKPISSTNSFQNDFMWGKAELIEYTNKNGIKLQGILYYPANYEVGKKYPMITYIYEKLSRGYHYYSRPSKTSYYNTTVFTSNDYFVLKPDILFDAGDPGISSTSTLEIAVKTVVDMGLVEEKRVGLVGHSWGGYQAAFVPTQTDIFAATVAGAGLTNLISMYGAITPAFGGQAENGHFEVSQERMMVPPWLDAEGYIRNSPVMNIEKLNTPILFEVGTADMNVNKRQGVEYYNAARRAGKQFVLLQYADEGHGLRQEKNQMDYQKRILSWFDHYLNDEPAEDWITEGIPYNEQQRRLKDWDKK